MPMEALMQPIIGLSFETSLSAARPLNKAGSASNKNTHFYRRDATWLAKEWVPCASGTILLRSRCFGSIRA